LKESTEGFLEERTVTEWGIQIADVLSYLHSQTPPIIYRDMKPANIMLDERDRIVLVDFGIARFVAPTQKNVTAIGTMGYAPPELFAGKVEARSDIYSLGATMFHLLTGRDPQDNPLLLFDFNRNPRPRQINPKLTQDIDEILAKSVEHKPANRFASAAEMRKALEEHLKRLNSAASADAGEVSFCGQCGQKLATGTLFCHHCGMPQKGGQAAAPAVPLTASIVFVGANNQPISFILNKDSNLIGRLDSNRGIIPDIDLTPFDKEGKVSRRHAIVHRQGETVSLEDLGSTNGSFVNGERLQPKQPRVLNSADELRLGETPLRYYLGAIPTSFPPPKPIQSAPASVASPSIAGGTMKNAVVDIPSVKPASSGPSPSPPGASPKLPSGRSGATPRISSEQIAAAEKSAPKAGKEGAASKPAAPANYARFVTNVDFPKDVKLGETVELRISLSPIADAGGNGKVKKDHEHDREIKATIANAKEPPVDVSMDLYIAAPGFEIEPDIFARLVVSITQSSAPKTFQLKAVQAGATTVTLDFYQDADHLSSVSVETKVAQ
jgi:serine/threonine-protein kinase